MKTINKIILASLLLVLCAGCSRDLLDEDPNYIPTADKLYLTAEGFQEGLNGVYSLMRREREEMSTAGGVGGQYLRASMFFVGTDNISTGSNTGGQLSTLLNAWGVNNGPANKTIREFFEWLYEVVNSTNTIIGRSDNPEVNWAMGGSGNHKGRIVGEARFMRAWAYRHLISLWGDVPLILEETTGDNIRTDYTRETEENIRRQMVEDLLYAAENIAWLPYNSGSIGKGAALTYLAETYLALGEYEQAERYATICIGQVGAISSEDAARFGNTIHSLMPDYAEMFKPANVGIGINTETLWTMQWAKDVIGGGNNMMRYGTVTYFTGQRDVTVDPEKNFNNKTIGIQGTDANGSWGWGQSAMTKHTFQLFFESSTDDDISTFKNNDWNDFRYERRGDDKIIRKYFILTSSDVVTPGTVNSLTGQEWQVGDTVWFTRSTADAAVKSNAMGMDYTKYNLNRNNFPYPIKFATCDPGFAGATESHQNQMYIRLAETYLIRAEARYLKGDVSGAVNDINVLRTRAEALPVTAENFGSSTRDGLDFILDERTRELSYEEHRRNTLARMGRKEFLFRRIKKYNERDKAFDQKDIYLAIPQSVIDANRTKEMKNNPGISGGPAIDWNASEYLD